MGSIKCENYFCIYFCNGVCRLDKITLSLNGSCNSCIYVDIKESYLKEKREKLLKVYDEC